MIGMATTCAMEGEHDDQIKTLGRWKSWAYLRYIRTIEQFCDMHTNYQEINSYLSIAGSQVGV